MASGSRNRRVGRTLLGVLLGVVAALAIMPLLESAKAKQDGTEVGPILSDCDGSLREIVIHYSGEDGETVFPVYCDFLAVLPADVTVRVVAPGRAVFDELVSAVGEVACTLKPVIVDHEITSWSRDRWIALGPAKDRLDTTLVAPRGEMGAEIWPGRKGDERVAEELAETLIDTAFLRSGLWFDGGDFVADSETVFVTPNVLRRNLQVTVKTRDELVTRLKRLLGRKVVLLDDAPDHHAGMFMMAVGGRTVLVGDPRAAKGLIDGDGSALLPGGADFSEETAAKFDAVAKQCEAAGYRVVRIPLAAGVDGRTFVTSLNAILETRGGRRIVYMPTVSGAELLNAAAREVWEGLGYDVRPVDCTSSYRMFGSLRCLVNVASRSEF